MTTLTNNISLPGSGQAMLSDSSANMIPNASSADGQLINATGHTYARSDNMSTGKGLTTTTGDQLTTEFAEWYAASDEALLNFESGLAESTPGSLDVAR